MSERIGPTIYLSPDTSSNVGTSPFLPALRSQDTGLAVSDATRLRLAIRGTSDLSRARVVEMVTQDPSLIFELVVQAYLNPVEGLNFRERKDIPSSLEGIRKQFIDTIAFFDPRTTNQVLERHPRMQARIAKQREDLLALLSGFSQGQRAELQTQIDLISNIEIALRLMIADSTQEITDTSVLLNVFTSHNFYGDMSDVLHGLHWSQIHTAEERDRVTEIGQRLLKQRRSANNVVVQESDMIRLPKHPNRDTHFRGRVEQVITLGRVLSILAAEGFDPVAVKRWAKQLYNIKQTALEEFPDRVQELEQLFGEMEGAEKLNHWVQPMGDLRNRSIGGKPHHP